MNTHLLTVSLLAAGATLAPIPLAPIQSPGGDDSPPELAEAQALRSAGRHGEALAKAEAGLESAPSDPRLLWLASLAATDLGKKDEALWYANLARREVGGAKEPKERAALAAEIEARVAALDPLGPEGRAALDGWANATWELARTAAAKKLYVNAVDLYSSLAGTPLESRADVELDKIYDNKKAVEALLESGLDVPIRSKKKRSPAAIAREDSKHADWGSAWQVKSDNYTVVTNMGQEMAQSMSLAMEQMNRFYRRVFGVREHGGNTARCTIRVYRSRAEFDAHEGQHAPEVRGFFVNGLNRVATYDPRSDGMSIAFLWSTLFHEASHQFTDMISADLIPAWLNEGTASYFEGARLLANGSVETGLVAEHRLSALAALLKRGSPKLKDVVSFYERGSYPGDYYPFGWGLVYFLHNYEDEDCARPYRAIYGRYLGSYRTGGKHDPFERFVEFFVGQAKQPGVATFEDFEARFAGWVHELNQLYFGPPEKADALIERARRQNETGHAEAAAESYRWALDKRAGDALASFELGELEGAGKRKDAACFRLRAALAVLSRMDPDATVAGPTDLNARALTVRCRQRMAALDKDLDAAFRAAEERGQAQALASARAYADQGFPRAALELQRAARRFGGGSRELDALADEIRSRTGVTLARWRRIPAPIDLAGWDANERWRSDAGAIATESRSFGVSLCTWRGELAPPFRFQARLVVEPLGKEAVAGLVFGANAKGMRLAGVFQDGTLGVAKLDDKLQELAALPALRPEQTEDFLLAVEVQEGGAAVYVDGRKAGAIKARPDELAGSVGLYVQSAKVRFSELRVRQ